MATPKAAAATPPPLTKPMNKPPSASLYVGDISPEVTEGMLFEIFNSVGPVSSIRVCRDTLTRRSLGYSYVNFHSIIDAERALDSLNNHVIQGRPCRIMWSQRDPSIRKTGVGNIFIKNLDPLIGHKELYDTFSAFGNILSCKVAMDERGQSKGYGFVHFENQQCADKAIETVNDNMLLSKKVYVGPFIPRKVRSQQLEKSWTNVFIKDLDTSIDSDALKKAFSEYGEITSAIVMTKDDGTSLGFGFVNFASHDDAVKSVEEMHGKELGSKAIFCCRAQKKAEREAKLRKDWEQQKISKYQGINLYIKNIEDIVDEERLREEFAVYGTIKSCKIMVDDNGRSKGFGFVCFSAPEESQRAMSEMNNRILPRCTKPLYVALHEPKMIRRQKLTLNAIKGIRGNVPQGAPTVYGPTGQPVYYPSGNMSQGFVYPQQIMASMSRGWSPQYPMHAYSPNTVGVMQPRGGGQAGGSTRGRGGNANSRAGRGRRNNQQGQVVDQQQQQQQQQQQGISIQPIELTLQQLATWPEDQQKLLLGERLYPLIAERQPQLAGKITGMFLDSGWPVDELFSLISDEAKLTEKIDDAISVLERAAQNAEGGENVEADV